MTQNSDSAPISRRKKLAFTGIVIGVILLAGEFGASVYLRMARGYDGKHLVQYEFDAYKNILPTRNFVDTRGIRHNSVGFRRSTEVVVEKPEGTYRVFLMGASTAYGLGGLWPHIQDEFAVIDNTQTIDAYLERLLQARFPGKKIEVINAAVTSTWTHHNLIYLNQTILRYSPDMILFLDGFNDFYHFRPDHDQFAAYAYGEQSARILGEPTIASLAFQNFWWLYRRSALVHLAGRGMRNAGLLFARNNRQPLDVERSFTNLQRVFPENALAMVSRYIRIAADAGVVPVEIHQPMLILERERKGMRGIEQELFEFNVKSFLPNYEELMHRAVPWVTDTLGHAVRNSGGVFIDATGIYADVEGQVYTDYCHLTPLGNSLLAGFIAERIIPHIEVANARSDRVPSTASAKAGNLTQ